MFFFAPKALMRFLKALVSADKLRERPADSKKNRNTRLKKKGKAGYGVRAGQRQIGTYGQTMAPSDTFEPEPFEESPRTALALLTEDSNQPNRRSLDPTIRASISNTMAVQDRAFAVNDEALIMEMDMRSDQISNTLENDMVRLDDQIDFALRQNAENALDISDTTTRLLAGNQAEIDRLMNRVEEIERTAQAIEAQAANPVPVAPPVAPWWVTQMRRQQAAAGQKPAPQAARQPNGAMARMPQAAANPYSPRTIRPAAMPVRSGPPQTQSPRQVDPVTRQKLNMAAQQAQKRKGVSPTAAAKVAAAPKSSLPSRIMAMPGRGMNLLARFAQLREKAHEVRHEMTEAEHNFLLELQQRKEDKRRERKLNRKAAAPMSPQPRGPNMMKDPTKVG